MAKIVLIPGSLHKNSLNRQLLEVCVEVLKQKNVETLLIPQTDLDVALISLDDPSRFPASMKTLAEKIAGADAVIVGCPEYNGSMSPVIKNFMDWTSAVKPHPWKNKPVLLVGTSPGDFGAISGLAHSRSPFDRLGAFLWPQPYALPHGNKVIVGTKLNDETRQKNLETTLTSFLDCLKK